MVSVRACPSGEPPSCPSSGAKEAMEVPGAEGAAEVPGRKGRRGRLGRRRRRRCLGPRGRRRQRPGGGPLFDHDQVAADAAVRFGQRGAVTGPVERVQVRFLVRDDDVDAGQLAEFAQLLGGELGVRRATPADHVDLADLARLQGLQNLLRHVGAVQLGRVPGQDAGHVHRHVADADDRDRLGVEGERAGADVRVPAVPVDEVGGRVAAGQVLPRDAEAAVAHRAGRVDHRVVGRQQVGPGHVVAEVHAAEKPDVRAFQHLAQVLGDRLDRLVVGGDPVPDQPVRSGQPVEDVDPHPDRTVRAGQRGRVFDQGLRGVQSGRPGADDCDLEHSHISHPRPPRHRAGPGRRVTSYRASLLRLVTAPREVPSRRRLPPGPVRRDDRVAW